MANGEKQAFCTISDCNKHSPPNIMAHLIPVIRHFMETKPGITKLYLQSDSPTTQYRGKEMFYLTTQYLPTVFPALTSIVYGYSEAGHGKGAVDGVGGWAKNMTDAAVVAGLDIYDARDMVNHLKTKSDKTLIMLIDSEAHKEVEVKIPKNLKTFEGTMKVHSFTWEKEKCNEIHFGSLSCRKCEAGQPCSHFGFSNSPLTYIPIKSVDETEDDDPPPLPVPENKQGKRKPKVNDWIAVLYAAYWYPGKFVFSEY